MQPPSLLSFLGAARTGTARVGQGMQEVGGPGWTGHRKFCVLHQGHVDTYGYALVCRGLHSGAEVWIHVCSQVHGHLCVHVPPDGGKSQGIPATMQNPAFLLSSASGAGGLGLSCCH